MCGERGLGRRPLGTSGKGGEQGGGRGSPAGAGGAAGPKGSAGGKEKGDVGGWRPTASFRGPHTETP